MPPEIDHNKCISCHKCVNICAEDVFFGSKKGDKPKVTYPEVCWHCNCCILECPVKGAIWLRTPLTMMVAYK